MNDSVREPAGGLGTPNPTGSLSVVLAGGGTAGHVEPAMAVADALTALDPMTSDALAGSRPMRM